jgi:hypothetical protein
MEDAAFCKGTASYRKTCGLDPISIDRTADFTGTWRLNEYESKIQNAGPSNTPYKLEIAQVDNEMRIRSTSIVEWADDEVTTQSINLDGSDVKSTVFNNSPRVQNAHWSPQQDSLTIQSKVSFNFGGRALEVKTRDVWMLERRGQKLVISQTVNSFRGTRNSTLVYDKQ